jgi:hypothetical protein
MNRITEGVPNGTATTRLYPRAQLVLRLLETNGWVCGQDLVEASSGYAYATRLSDVRLGRLPGPKASLPASPAPEHDV